MEYLVFALILGAGVGISWYLAQRRREAWRRVAAQMHFQFDETGYPEHMYASFKLFAQGHSRSAYNVITGRGDDGELRLFDYRYTVGHGKGSSTYHQTVCIIKVRGLDLPHFFVRRESTIYDFLGKVFGGQDINFPNDEAFSKAFVLQGEREVLVQELFNARVRRALMHFEGTNMQVEGRGDLLVFNPCELVDPSKAAGLILKTVNVKKAFLPPPQD